MNCPYPYDRLSDKVMDSLQLKLIFKLWRSPITYGYQQLELYNFAILFKKLKTSKG